MNRNAGWSHPVRLDEVPPEGAHFVLEADSSIREALARVAEVNAVETAEAQFDLRRTAEGGLNVSGRVSARVEQRCSVTLEPVTNDINEAVNVTFADGPAPERPPSEERGLDSVDPPDVAVDGRVDLGAVATEFLILGVDPYPRKPGVVFETPAPDPADSPFAALAKLRGAMDSGTT